MTSIWQRAADKSLWVWEAMGDIAGDGEEGGDFECASVLMGHGQDEISNLALYRKPNFLVMMIQ